MSESDEKNFLSRENSGFLWLPKTVGEELRWLEYAEWLEVYCLHRTITGAVKKGWKAYRWTN